MIRKTTIVLALLIASNPTAASAFIWAEIPDAGELLGTAQMTAGAGALTDITGTLTLIGDYDVDLYCINITSEGLFTATTNFGGGFAGFDSQLFLFDASGMGVAANDDQGSSLMSTLTSTWVTTNGSYYLGISGYDKDPSSVGGLIFPNTPTGGEHTNTGPGGASPLSGWVGSGEDGSYNVALTGSAAWSSSVVPEPGSLLLLASGLLGVMGYRVARRRKPRA